MRLTIQSPKRPADPKKLLTQRQHQVAMRVRDGFGTRAIAEELNISVTRVHQLYAAIVRRLALPADGDARTLIAGSMGRAERSARR